MATTIKFSYTFFYQRPSETGTVSVHVYHKNSHSQSNWKGKKTTICKQAIFQRKQQSSNKNKTVEKHLKTPSHVKGSEIKDT